MNKEELIEYIKSKNVPSLSPKEVIGLVSGLSLGKRGKPKKLKKGDVYITGVGSKHRPCVVIKIIDTIVISLPLSTTEDELNLVKGSSRFFGDSFVDKGVVFSKYDYAIDNFIGIYGNNRVINQAVENIKVLVNEI